MGTKLYLSIISMRQILFYKGNESMLRKFASNKIFVIVIAVFCCALWGISTPIVKMGYNYLNASHTPSLLLWVGLVFFVSGLIIIGGYSVFKRRPAFPQKKSLKRIFAVSIFQTILQYSLLYIGLAQTTSVKGAILKSTDVFFVALISSIVFKSEKLTAKKLIACIIGFLGIVVMNLDGLSLNINLGDVIIIIAILSYSVSVVMTKLFAQKENPIVLCGYQMGLGGIVLALIGLALGGKFDFFSMFPVFISLALIYAVSYTLWTILLKYKVIKFSAENSHFKIHDQPQGVTLQDRPTSFFVTV